MVDLVDLGDAAFVRRVYDEIMVPAFPPNELDDRTTFCDHLLSGAGSGVVALALTDAERTPLGVIVGFEYPEHHVLLIGYLAVGERRRGSGRGSTLLGSARDRWFDEDWCHLVLAEAEDPRHHVDPDRDPRRRLAFYARHGARLVARPYFQPRLRPALDRVYGMLLIVLQAAPAALVGSAIRSTPVAGFLHAYFEESEAGAQGSAGDDEMMARLWRAYSGPGDIELLAIDGYEAVEQIRPPDATEEPNRSG